MTLAADLLAALPGVPVRADDPTVLDRWLAGHPTIEDAALTVVASLPAADIEAVFDAMRAPDFGGLLACSDTHPYLAELAAWVTGRPDLVLVAAPTGPPPPAVLVLERDRSVPVT